MEQIGTVVNQSLSKPSGPWETSPKAQRAAAAAKRLFDFCPPQDVANDPYVFLTGVVELFMAYPVEIFERAVSTVDGLPSKHKWAPRISEIKEELERLMLPIRREEERQEREREYRRYREQPVSRTHRPAYEELKADCAEDGLILGGRASTRESTKEFRERLGISAEQWNAIPDAKHG